MEIKYIWLLNIGSATWLEGERDALHNPDYDSPPVQLTMLVYSSAEPIFSLYSAL